MLDEVIDQIRALDDDHEYRALAEHISVTSPEALDRLARDELTTPSHEAQRVAAVQLRVIHEFANKLRWIEGLSLEHAKPATRVALMTLLQSLCESDLLAGKESKAATLLEPAILFHALLSRLRPWLPPMVLALEPEPVVDLLMLGIPDYLHPILRERFSQLWSLFHRVRALPEQQLEAVGELDELGELDVTKLVRVLDLVVSARSCPPPPLWATPSWVTPWRLDGPRGVPPLGDRAAC